MILRSRQFDETTSLKTVADDAKVSEAMIVKIAKKLGFTGFKEFRSGIVDYNRRRRRISTRRSRPTTPGPRSRRRSTSIHALRKRCRSWTRRSSARLT